MSQTIHKSLPQMIHFKVIRLESLVLIFVDETGSQCIQRTLCVENKLYLHNIDIPFHIRLNRTAYIPKTVSLSLPSLNFK